MKIYTRTGDKGETGLLGGKRIPKDSLNVAAYGNIDELNSVIGVAISFLEKRSQDEKAKEILLKIQNDLFTLGAEISASNEIGRKLENLPKTTEGHVKFLETTADEIQNKIGLPKHFILPGGSRASAFLHQARTVCRRAERNAIALSRTEEMNPQVISYLNRLSSLLFMLARFVNTENETAPKYE